VKWHGTLKPDYGAVKLAIRKQVFRHYRLCSSWIDPPSNEANHDQTVILVGIASDTAYINHVITMEGVK